MSRSPAPAQIEVAPSNNIYTALSGAGAVAVLLGLVVLILRAKSLGVDLWKF